MRKQSGNGQIQSGLAQPPTITAAFCHRTSPFMATESGEKKAHSLAAANLGVE
jgi:hypothetical protein